MGYYFYQPLKTIFMKKKYSKRPILFIMLLFFSFSQGQTVLHYWNFNTNTSVSAITTPTQTNIAGASLAANIAGITVIDFAGGTGQNFSVLNLNARNADVSGAHLRFNDPIGSSLVFALPTTNYENAIVKFATRRSGSGAGTQVWSYSTDGTTFTFFANVTPNNGDPGLATLDFSSISAADNNPNFKLKVEFAQGAGGTVGNNRFDNFTIEGTLISGSDTTAPTVAFSPLNSATNVAKTISPTIIFNESVRLINNDAITNANIDAVVEVRLNNASGAVVPFDATFASNTITIVPSTTLATNELYYVALLANTIEDASDNAITTLQSATFTTAKPTVILSTSATTGTEVGTTVITVTATADVAVNGDQTVNLGVTGTAITAGDYTLSNTVITISSGQTSGSVTFAVVNDALVEGTEVATLTITNPSSGIVLGSTSTQAVTIADNDAALNIDLSNYVRVGRYDLPEPTRTAHPANNLLCQEASAVTYNWDTDTLFITADGSTSVTQVSKTGQFIDTMTMAQGSSPQGTDFYDTEGLTYIGNGEFVMSEERDRQLVKFTYVAGTTLSRANTQTVKIGTFVPNTGTEGLSYDPLTNGYIALKEITPIGIFQTGVDFAAGTATNGSATTENSTNLFDPALLGFSDVADVFALSNLPSLNGQSLYNNLLVLSQENAKVVHVDRNGVIVNTLNIVSDAGNPLDVASQQHEGLTMDRDGNLYIVSENGGGTIDYPQLWVYAPSNLPNQAPTAIALNNTTTSILENSNTTAIVKVADISVTDDGLGTNALSLSGADANSFQITGSSLYIKAGTVIDYETKTSYSVTVNVDDTTIGSTPDASVNFVLSVTDVVVETTPIVSVSITEAASWSSGTTSVGADWFEVTNNGNAALDITGWKVDDSSNSFTSALALTGITSIAAGESVIFLETSATNAATIIANFKSTWFGANVPAGLQIGSYTGSGIGLSTGGDAVNLFNAAGVVQANISFGAATTNFTFNNAASLSNSAVTTLSQIGVNDAFAATNDAVQIGSPGTIGKIFISEIAPWSSSNSSVGADWFEVTNTKAVAVDITGWKVDDNSQSPAAAVALNGITSINPGESVIFIETTDLATKTTAFLNNWFGTNPTSGLRIGSYTGSGIGLSSSGDQVNLYNGLTSTPVTSVLFGASPTVAPFTTFDNSMGQNSLVTPISHFSAVGTKGAFVAANSTTEIGSPGTFVATTCPTITATATPASTTVCSGTTTTVTVTAAGGTLPYTVSGSPLTVGVGMFNYTITDAKGCTATATVTITEQLSTDTITQVSACDAYTWNGITYTESGLYTGTTTNCITEKLNLTIIPNGIVLQPTQPTICKSIGAKAIVTVTAPQGSTYKWYSQSVTGTTWTLLANNTNYSGVNGAELTITRTATTLPATGTKYRVVISNICGDATSDIVALQELAVLSKVAVITAKSASNAILSPASTTCSGSAVNLTLAAGSIGDIQWQVSTTSATTGFTNFGTPIAQSALSAVNPLQTISSGVLSQDTWFRVIATNGVCSSVTSVATKISVSAPAVAGIISGGNIKVCAFSANALDSTGTLVPFNNTTILELVGNTGTIVWQKSTNYNTTTPTWTAAGSTTSPLNIANLTVDTWYRAQVTNGACKVFTDAVKITVNKVARAGVTTATTNGVVTTNVCTGGDITFTSAAYTGSAIQWEVSTTSSTTGFTAVDGATGISFTMQNVSYAPLSRFYVRSVVNSEGCTIARSSVKTITVNPISVPGTITGGGTLCSGGGSTIKIVGYKGTIQWLYSTNGTDYLDVPSLLLPNVLAGFETVSTGKASTYVFTNFTAGTVYFKAKIKSGACSETFTNVVRYDNGTTAVAGTVSALNSIVCPGTGTALTLSNSIGSVQWQKATVSATTGLPGTFVTIPNQTGTTLATGNLVVSTAYQAVITIGTCSILTTDYIVVNVVAKPIAKSITSNVTSPIGGITTPLCTNDPKKTLTIGAGYTGAIQWQTSTVSTTTGFTNIDGATTASYVVTNPSVGVNYYRATFTNTCGTVANSAPITLYFKNCNSSTRIADAKEKVEIPFNVFSYPNPFNDNFKLSLESSSDERVNVTVFDLSGKLIEQREINSYEINTLDLGNNYPSGVFNVMVSQGTTVKTVRVVKQ
jgi:uncharacterized protein YjiK